MKPIISENPDRSRFEATVDGELAGFVDYTLRDTIIDFTHTEILPAYEGKGVGGTLVRRSLDEIRARGDRSVVATCPFVAGWIDRHPDYRVLLSTT